MRYDINAAAKRLAKALNTEVGERRTHDQTRMRITWTLTRRGRNSGLIDLVCEDGYGDDGMAWQGELHVCVGGASERVLLLTKGSGYTGRKAKRMTRRRFVEQMDAILARLPKQLLDELRNCVIM